jgi:hypothetical protein
MSCAVYEGMKVERTMADFDKKETKVQGEGNRGTEEGHRQLMLFSYPPYDFDKHIGFLVQVCPLG